MSESPSFVDVIKRLDSGDEQAAAEVFRRFTNRLIGLARRRLDARYLHRVEPEDVLQSVWKSFFRRYADGRFDVDGWDGLWGLLAVITLRKCGHRVESLHAACRSITREVQQPANVDDSLPGWDAAARDPSPDEIAALTETLELVMSELTEQQQQILTLRLQGGTVLEISTQVGRTERTVFRTLETARARLQRFNTADD